MAYYGVSLETFESLLRQTHRVARDGARLCYRNLLARRKHLPSLDGLFIPDDELAARLLLEDRSFVYSHFEIATALKPKNAGRNRALNSHCGGLRDRDSPAARDAGDPVRRRTPGDRDRLL